MRQTFSDKQRVVLYALSLNTIAYDKYAEHLNNGDKKEFKSLIETLINSNTEKDLDKIKAQIKETNKKK